MALPTPVGGYSVRLPSSSYYRLLLRPISISDFPNPNNSRKPGFRNQRCTVRPLRRKLLASARFRRLLTSDEEEVVGESFLETIGELERMMRDPSDVLAEMTDRLSARELQLVLVYFAQEGRDSYCALEVFDWLRRENRVDGETMELMVSIACGWIERIIGVDHDVDNIVALLNEMDCVGLEPGFNMVEKIVSLYWDRGKKEQAVVFVKDVMRREGAGVYGAEDGWKNGRGGAVGYVAWKMMVDGNYIGAVKMVIEFKEIGLRPGVYSYLIALTSLVKEQKELSKALGKLNGALKAGKIDKLDSESISYINNYQAELIRYAVCLSEWANEEGNTRISSAVYERLLAIYACAGFGLEAEQQIWQMKLLGTEPDRDLYDAVLAICASQNEVTAVHRLLTGIEDRNAERKKKSLSWLLRGYLKGGYYLDASETLVKMLDLGLFPEYIDRAAVLEGLRKIVQVSGNMDPYIKLCKCLCDSDLIGPCLIYVYIKRYKLWIVNML